MTTHGAADSNAAPLPPKLNEPSEQERVNGTANMLNHAAEAAAANDEEDEATHLRTTDQQDRRGRPTNRVMSADSFYGYNTGLSESPTNSVPEKAPTVPGSDEEPPPPAYSNTLGHVSDEDSGAGTEARVGDDGRVNIRIDQRSHKLSRLLVPALRQQRQLIAEQEPPPPPYIPPNLGGSPGELPPPPMNVVIHVVGSRGDVQPFVALGKVLRDTYNHRVRLATHPVFKTFVEENGLEFFSIGGDPSELMAFMVKNPGLLPGFDTLRNGDVGKRRKGIAEMIRGCWRSCIEAGDGEGIEASDDAIGDWMTNPDSTFTADGNTFRPFVADAIIANPPSFAHIHCAEMLGIPLHMMFTMPWSPTEAFPHPLANIESTNAEQTISNYITYGLIDLLTWQGLGDIINRFRVHNLGLEPINFIWAPGMLARLKIPYTYCWSPALIPKPADWASHISISGFYFLNLASNYTPAPDLQAFLDAGPPPVYIGFGSIVVDDPNAMTTMIFEAVKSTGQRALVSKGWGGLGADELGVPEGVFMLGNVPHDWLFKHVSCVVHHGGAGTTAAGIACGKPTVIVPFFGDQPFWGAMVNRAGAGPKPVAYKKLTAEILAESILDALKPSSLERAREMEKTISTENGCETGAQSFHQMLDIDKMRCSILPEQIAVWRIKRTAIRLSALAAYVLAEKEIISFSDLKLYRHKEYEVDTGPPDPFSGGAGAIVDSITTVGMGVADFPIAALKALAIHPDAHKSKEEKEVEKKEKEAEKKEKKDEKDKKKRTKTGSSEQPSGINTPTLPSTPDIGESRSLDTASTASSEHLSRESTQSSATSDTTASSILSSGAATPTPTTSTPLSPRPGGSAMAEALRNLPDSSRPRSRSGSRTRHNTHKRSNSESNPHKTIQFCEAEAGESVLDTAYGTGKGVSKIVGAGLKSPMDFLLGLSKGFHNVPKLYGEEVRQTDRVTGIKSGFRVAGKEFGIGMFDGITGLVTQPLQGAKKEGAAGFMKGIGKGLAGIVVKPGAGIYGLPGYAMKGIYKEIQKHFGASVTNYIIAARTAQGWEAWLAASKEEQTEIVHRYLKLFDEVKRKKIVGGDQVEAVQDFIDESKERRKARWAKLSHKTEHLHEELKNKGKGKGKKSGSSTSSSQRANSMASKSTSELLKSENKDEIVGTHLGTGLSARQRPTTPHAESTGHVRHASTMPITMTSYDDGGDEEVVHAHNDDFERALQQSIRDTSVGNTEEDRAIDNAIRASIKHLESQVASGTLPAADADDDDEQLRRAIAESLKGVQGGDPGTKSTSLNPPIPPRSPLRSPSPRKQDHAALNTAAADVGMLEPGGSSLVKDAQIAADEDGDEELKKAIEESKAADAEQEKARREEEIVLEYIKKQSLAEEEHRKRMAAGKAAAGEGSG